MTETPQKRGRPKGVKSTHVMIRMPDDLLDRIDAYAETLQAQIGISDVSVSRAMAIRELCKRGLQSFTSVPPASGPQTFQPSTTPEPAAQPAPASHTNSTRAPATGATLSLPGIPHGEHTVVQEKARRRSGRLSNLRQPIMALVREHPEGLTAVQIKVFLGVEKNIGDTLSGMVRQHRLAKHGSGQAVRYVVDPSA